MARKKPVVSPDVVKFCEGDDIALDAWYPAVLFRNCVYVASPRHADAINLAFAGMTDKQKLRVSWAIGDRKEKMLFGHAKGDGSEWEWNEEFQESRMTMYNFLQGYK